MKYIYSIILDATIASFLLIGITHHIEGAINVGYFAGWFFSVIKVLAYLFSSDSLAKEYKHAPVVFRAYDLLTDIAYVTLFVYQGWFVLGAFCATGAIAKAAFQSKQEELLSRKK